MGNSLRAVLLLVMAAAIPAIAASAEPMTNADVLKMVNARLPESTIVMAIGSAEPDFDTSPDALIQLANQGVPPAVIEAMLGTGKSGGKSSSGAVAAGGFDPEKIILVDGDKSSTMRYLIPDLRTGARALGFGGIASYAVLRGTRASTRIESEQPEFILAVPENAQPESYYAIVNFAVRKNRSREILIGGGYMGYSTGVPQDRVIATVAQALDDQSTAPEDVVLYSVKPSAPMPPGEYAVILFNSEFRTPYYPVEQDSYFDFGVD
jgi:hypothetical protein